MIKISLVDDDPSDRSFLHSLVSDSFEKTGIDVEISEFESAEDFLSVFEPEIFDLCFLRYLYEKNEWEWTLPDKSGSWIRSWPLFS